MVLKSKTLERFSRITAFLAFFLCLTLQIHAQNTDLEVKFTVSENSKVRIEGKFANGRTEKSFSFLRSLAGADNLERRIENLRFFDSSNCEISFRKLADGDFLTGENTAGFSYDVLLKTPGNPTDTAHVSWLTETGGILMTGDVLPQFTNDAATRIVFVLPREWKISSGEKQESKNAFVAEKPENAVFLIGSLQREVGIKIAGADLKMNLSGEWNFTDNEAAATASEILHEYREIFGEIPHKNIRVFLLRFPQKAALDRWTAETRGATVTILSSPTIFKSLELQRLREQLRHELFHLWMPNALKLSGDYSWFYEGFAGYIALKTGVELNQIRFTDFLDTLGQAYNIASRREREISLIEASKTRWIDPTSSVYAKGLLVAFLCDVALVKGNKDIRRLLREIYRRHGLLNDRQDANSAILKIFGDFPELAPVVENHIKAGKRINLQNDLRETGIEVSGTKLSVKAKPKGSEKDLLDKLGYNNWRKLLRKGK